MRKYKAQNQMKKSEGKRFIRQKQKILKLLYVESRRIFVTVNQYEDNTSIGKRREFTKEAP